MNSTSISTPEAIATTPRIGLGRIPFQRLASGASWTLAASIAAALSQWLLLMVTAKLGSTEMVGQLALSFAIVAPIQALTDLALRPALATDANHDFHFRDYLGLRRVREPAVRRPRRQYSIREAQRWNSQSNATPL
jgi:hypothetical protein